MLTLHSGSRLFGGHFRPEGSKWVLWVGIGYFLPKIIIVRVTGSEAPFHLTALALGTLLLAKLQVRPLIHSDREVGMRVFWERTSPWLPLDRCPANPRPPLRMARRDAALL